MTDAPVATASRLRQDAGARDEAEAADVYARYQTRVAARSARSLQQSRELLACVSRGLITPADLDAASRTFMRTQANAHALAVADVYARFFAGLARLVAEPWTESGRELAGVTGVDGQLADPQPIDEANPGSWFEQLAALALRASRNHVTAFHTNVVSAAETSGPGAGRKRAAAAGRVEGAARLSRLTALYVDLIDGISEAASAGESGYLRGVLATAYGAASGTPGGLRLEGLVGQAAEASLSIENTTSARATIRCSVSPVRRADGIGPAFAPQAVVTPAHVLLQAGEDTHVRLQVALEAGNYEAGAVYVGTLYVHRDGEPRLDVPLRIIPVRAVDRAGAR